MRHRTRDSGQQQGKSRCRHGGMCASVHACALERVSAGTSFNWRRASVPRSISGAGSSDHRNIRKELGTGEAGHRDVNRLGHLVALVPGHTWSTLARPGSSLRARQRPPQRGTRPAARPNSRNRVACSTSVATGDMRLNTRSPPDGQAPPDRRLQAGRWEILTVFVRAPGPSAFGHPAGRRVARLARRWEAAHGQLRAALDQQ